MKKIIYSIIIFTFCSCEKKIDFTCTDKIYDNNGNLIYKSEPYIKNMTDTEWNTYINKQQTKTTVTSCCKPHK